MVVIPPAFSSDHHGGKYQTSSAGSSALEYLQVWWLANTQTRCPSYWPTRRPLSGKLGAVGGPGGKLYDTMFRQHAATDPFTDWSKLNSSLYAVTFLAQSNGRGRCCQCCLESDHGGQECALAPNYQPYRPQRSSGWGPTAGFRLGEGRNDWRQELSTGGKGKTRMARQQRLDRVCYAWNDGDCKFPACRYQHVCAKCQGEHKAPACSTYPHKQREAAPK